MQAVRRSLLRRRASFADPQNEKLRVVRRNELTAEDSLSPAQSPESVDVEYRRVSIMPAYFDDVEDESNRGRFCFETAVKSAGMKFRRRRVLRFSSDRAHLCSSYRRDNMER